jgi:hypothetical protein
MSLVCPTGTGSSNGCVTASAVTWPGALQNALRLWLVGCVAGAAASHHPWLARDTGSAYYLVLVCASRCACAGVWQCVPAHVAVKSVLTSTVLLVQYSKPSSHCAVSTRSCPPALCMSACQCMRGCASQLARTGSVSSRRCCTSNASALVPSQCRARCLQSLFAVCVFS